MKNICFVNTTPFWGGGEKWHVENAVALANRGYKVHFILNPKGEIKNRLDGTGIDLFEINIGTLSLINQHKKNLIAKYISDRKIESIIINDSRDLKTVGLVAKRLKVKQVIYRRGIALPPRQTRLNQFIYTKLVTDIIFNSLETKKQFFRNLDSSIIRAKQHLLYNGLEIKEYDTKPKTTEKIVIGNASRITAQKGIEFLIELAQKLKQNKLNAIIKIAGKGELEQKYQDEIHRLNLNDYIQLVGFYDDVHEFLSGLDIYICSSRFEGFGFSIAEAMLHKLPVIGFDISSNPEVIQNNETGYLVPPFDMNELYNKTKELINSPERRTEFGKEGFKKASEQFDRNKSFDKLIEIIEKK